MGAELIESAQGEFRRLRAASDFARGGKVTKTPPGFAPRSTVPVLQVAHPTPSGPSGHLPLTGGVGPGPHYGGRPPEKLCFISGAQNLTGGSKFPPGHWALGVQNLELLQFHNGAWVFSANAPGAFSPQGRPHVAARPSLPSTRGKVAGRRPDG